MVRPVTLGAIILSILMLSSCTQGVSESTSSSGSGGDAPVANTEVGDTEVIDPEMTVLELAPLDSGVSSSAEEEPSSAELRTESPEVINEQDPIEMQELELPDQDPQRQESQWGPAPSLVGAPLFAAQGIGLDLGLQVIWRGERGIDPSDPRCRVIQQMPGPGAPMQTPIVEVELRCAN